MGNDIGVFRLLALFGGIILVLELADKGREPGLDARVKLVDTDRETDLECNGRWLLFIKASLRLVMASEGIEE